MKRVLVVAFASAFLFACGGEEENDTPTTTTDAGIKLDAGIKPTDAGTQPTDAGTQPTDAGSTPSCMAASNLGTIDTFTLVDGYDDLDTDGVVSGYFDYNSDPDSIAIELWDETGVFTEGIKTGTFELTGDELNYETCGLCVKIEANYWDDNGQTYLATGGTVTLTSVSGRLTGTLTNVTFEHVTIDEETSISTPVNDGCTSKVNSMSFDAELEQSAK